MNKFLFFFVSILLCSCTPSPLRPPTPAIVTPQLSPAPTKLIISWLYSNKNQKISGKELKQDILTLQEGDSILSTQEYNDYEIRFDFEPSKITNTYPFLLYFNADSSLTPNAYYAVSYSNFDNHSADNSMTINEGPRWRIIKKSSNSEKIDYDFFYSTPVKTTISQQKHSVLIKSKSISIPEKSGRYVYISLQIDDQVLGSIVDLLAEPHSKGHIGFSAPASSFLVTNIAIESLKYPITPKKNTILTFGDSISFATNKRVYNHSTAGFLQQYLDDKYPKQYSVFNYGFSGERTSLLKETKYNEGLARFQQVIDLELPEYIFIEEGTNNMEEKTMPEDLLKMVSYAKQRGVKPILTTLTPLYNGVSLKDANVEIRKLAKRYEIPLVELWDEFTTPTLIRKDTTNPDLITSPRDLIDVDEVHPTVDGYRKLAKILFDCFVMLEKRGG